MSVDLRHGCKSNSTFKNVIADNQTLTARLPSG